MTNLVDRPKSSRGDRRREQLVEAGLALLSEHGWPGITARAVAERAGTNPGLIHYHFGGLPGLHAAIFRRGTDLLVNPLVDELLAAKDERAALDAVRMLLPRTAADELAYRPAADGVPASGPAAGDEDGSRLAAELIIGATRDPALGAMLRDELRRARQHIADRLRALHPGWAAGHAAGVATLVVAAIDGLMLHRMIDGELPVGEALEVAEGLLPVEEG
ncbi:TetR/AcrR family transcriptional regulator [Nonomuraea sp. NPDC049419]|uniref:TetR/AcrR family transcriptional regulator n=1 Tax=Nonomuraea sp. NPDC049419 TaxID=3155772 RepID=UPI0034337150